MNAQINVRFPDTLLNSAKEYAKQHGYGNVQDLIRETVRETVFDEPRITTQERALVKLLLKASTEKGLFGTEDELFEKLQ